MQNKKDYVIRTCLITKSNEFKSKMLRFVLINDMYHFDEKQTISKRAIYILNDAEVFQKFFKKYKIEIESCEPLFKILGKKKSSEKELLDILFTLKQSEFLIYGIDDNLDGLKRSKISLLVIASDISGKIINKFRKIAKLNNIQILFVSQKKKLTEIFEREVNVIGVCSKKVSRGILNKLEVCRESL